MNDTFRPKYFGIFAMEGDKGQVTPEPLTLSRGRYDVSRGFLEPFFRLRKSTQR
jgi:hypothetical protein